MTKIVFHEDAEQEYYEAFDYYANISYMLALRLEEHVREKFDDLMQLPRIHTPVGNGVRKCVLTKFPYTMFYIYVDDCVTIYAFAHHRRRPFYWALRRKPQDPWPPGNK
jgi:plasmid stabilization system protein ParE